MGPRSLRFRLMLAVVVLVLAAVVTVGIAARWATASRIERFLAEERALDAPVPDLASIAASVEEVHGREGWDGVQEWLIAWKESDGSGWDLVVLDPADQLRAASDLSLEEFDFETPTSGEIKAERGGEVLQLRVPSLAIAGPDEAQSGELFLFRLPSEHVTELSSHQTVFVSSISRFVLYTVVAAGLAAIALTWAATRHVLRPVEALTDAAKRLEAGDLSQRVHVASDDEIGRLGAAFNSMADAVQHNQAALRNMVSDTAHELRTPITNLRCQLEAIEDGLLEADDEALRSLREDVSLLQKLAEDLQVLALADAGALRVEMTACDLDEEANRAVRSVLAARTEPEPESELEPGAEIVVECAHLPAVSADPQRLQQIFANLLHNALDHTPAGGQVRIHGSERDGGVVVSVEDTGAGIAAEHLPRVFERYYRPDPSRQRATGGSGLGLSIVKRLVELQDGSVSIESTKGTGTTVAFTLARAYPVNPSRATKADAAGS
jgi:signal transduction histidine kinase